MICAHLRRFDLTAFTGLLIRCDLSCIANARARSRSLRADKPLRDQVAHKGPVGTSEPDRLLWEAAYMLAGLCRQISARG